jgi:nitroreductase
MAMDAAESIEFLRTLRTVRRFTDQPVPQAVLDDLLTVALERQRQQSSALGLHRDP